MHIAHSELIARLNAAVTVTDLWDEARTFFASHGITHPIYVYARGYRNTPEDTLVLSCMPEWWMEKYQREGYAARDPFFTYCCQTYDSIRTGIEYLRDYDYLSEQERGFIIEASETGFRSGATFIMRRQGLGPDFGGWNLGTSLPREEFEALYSRNGEVLRLAAMYVHEQLNLRLNKDVEEVNGYQRNSLTPRQIECLTWLAEGLRSEEIAEEMGIKPITVQHHIKQARVKLHATTREQAVARAIIKGLLQPK